VLLGEGDRGPPVIVLDVGLRAVVEQRAHERGVPILRGGVERRPPSLLPSIGIGTGSQQERRDPGVASCGR
jgi:hypothetical protein